MKFILQVLFVSVFLKLNKTQEIISVEKMPAGIFDDDLYVNSIDDDICDKQLSYLNMDENSMKQRFLEAGMRLPRGLYYGNVKDLGNFDECLKIHEEIANREIIEGKYCSIETPINANNVKFFKETFNFGSNINLSFTLNKELWKPLEEENNSDDLSANSTLIILNMAICIPRACSTQKGIKGLLNTNTSLKYHDLYCRLPNDKPWHAGDYVSMSIFSIIGLITLLSTCYDMKQKNGINKPSQLYTSFSLQKNIRQLFNNSAGKCIDCIDGIRAISALWVVMFHTLSIATMETRCQEEFLEWRSSFGALWIKAGNFAVDTFFLISGLLVVFTTKGKFTPRDFMKKIPWFYLNRYLRLFPMVASIILLEISLFFHISDGPKWMNLATAANECIKNWYSTLFLVRSWAHQPSGCLNHLWYLDMDIIYFVLSPFVLFWILRGRRSAWISMTLTFLLTIIGATVYLFQKNVASTRSCDSAEQIRYYKYYYLHPLMRVAPFIIGMITGYILSEIKNKKLKLSKLYSTSLWTMFILTTAVAVYAFKISLMKNVTNQVVINLLHIFMRVFWSVGIAWMIIACEKGYGGPVNWFLSLSLWKLLSKLSFPLYVVHYSVLMVTSNFLLSADHFSSLNYTIFKFFSDLFLSIVLAMLLTLLVDMPLTTIFGMYLKTRLKKSVAPNKNVTPENKNVAAISAISSSIKTDEKYESTRF